MDTFIPPAPVVLPVMEAAGDRGSSDVMDEVKCYTRVLLYNIRCMSVRIQLLQVQGFSQQLAYLLFSGLRHS